MKVHLIYENEDWLEPLVKELRAEGVPFEKWFIHQGHFDLGKAPPEGIFFNKMSPSSHTRGHVESVDYTRELLAWLEAHNRRVINGTRAFAMEVSKVRQYEALRRAGLKTPHTIVVAGTGEALKEAARQMPLPFITKHNRGGKGLGVQLFRNLDSFNAYVDSPEFSPATDHITLLQEYIQAPEPFITRCEFIDGEFTYAIQSNTSRGFLLCPADRCDVGDAFCPTTDVAPEEPDFNRQSLFTLREGFNDPIIAAYQRFLAENEVDLAGIEFIEDAAGNKITYDVNMNSNYSPAVEQAHGLNNSRVLVRFFARELEKARGRPSVGAGVVAAQA